MFFKTYLKCWCLTGPLLTPASDRAGVGGLALRLEMLCSVVVESSVGTSAAIWAALEEVGGASV